MFINLAPGPIGLPPMPWADLLRLAARHGFGGTDLPIDQISSEDDAHAAGEMARSLGLRWGLFGRPANFFGTEDEHAQGLRRLRAIAPLARIAGCTRTYDHIWPGHDERPYADNFAFHVQRLKPVAAILAEHGLCFGIEFIGPATKRAGLAYPFIHRLEQALELRDAVGEGTGIVLDFYHWHCSGGTLEDLRLLRGVPIVNVHANDARPDRTREEQIDHERAMPMTTGVIDAAAVLGVLMDLDYDGPVIAEPFKPRRTELAAMTPDDAADSVIACMRQVFAAAASRRAMSPK